MKRTQLKNFACFKQCLLLLMTISVGASYVLPPMKSYTVRTVSTTSSTVRTVSTNYEELRKCPSGFKPYSQHSLKPSAIKLIVTGLNSVQGTFTDYSVHCVTDYYAHLLFCCKPG